MMGKAKAKERLLSTLPDEFRKVAQQANVPLNDFPNPYEYAQTLATYDLSKLPKASKETLQLYEDVIERDLPGIMQHFTSTPGAPPPSASSLQPDGELRGWLTSRPRRASGSGATSRCGRARLSTTGGRRSRSRPAPRGNQISGAPRHGRDVVSVAASARWRGVFRPWTRRCRPTSPVTASVRWRGGSRRSTQYFSG